LTMIAGGRGGSGTAPVSLHYGACLIGRLSRSTS
jgi:hypothetical protein